MSQNQAKLLAQLRIGNEVASRYQELLEKQAQLKQAVQAVLPVAAKKLVDHERIFATQTDELTEKLAGDNGHVAAIELIRDLAQHRNAAELDAIGTPGTTEKTAGARRSTLTGGPVPDYDETESGQLFRQRLTGG